jgi:hypothetical protein
MDNAEHCLLFIVLVLKNGGLAADSIEKFLVAHRILQIILQTMLSSLF